MAAKKKSSSRQSKKRQGQKSSRNQTEEVTAKTHSLMTPDGKKIGYNNPKAWNSNGTLKKGYQAIEKSTGRATESTGYGKG